MKKPIKSHWYLLIFIAAFAICFFILYITTLIDPATNLANNYLQIAFHFSSGAISILVTILLSKSEKKMFKRPFVNFTVIKVK